MGATSVRMYPIWQDNFVIEYKENDGSDLDELRTYVKFDTKEKVMLANNPGNLVEVENTTIIGWAPSDSVDVFDEYSLYPFGGEIVPTSITLYPAHALHYTVEIATAGVFNEDKDNFQLNTVDIYTYYTNKLSFASRDFYAKCDIINYSFLGYSLTGSTDDLLSNSEYIFNY